MKVNQAKSNITFSSKIKFIDSEEFYKIHNIFSGRAFWNDIDFCPNYSENNFIFGNKAYSLNIQCCLVQGLTNLKNILMCHLHPASTIKEPDKLRKNLDEGIEKFGDKSSIKNGLIIGGWSCIKESKEVFLELVKKSLEIKPDFSKNMSVLWNRDGLVTNASYSAYDDTWLIGISDLYKNGKTQKQMLSRIKEQFPDRYICDRDEVFFNDQRVPKSLINSKKTWWQNSI